MMCRGGACPKPAVCQIDYHNEQARQEVGEVLCAQHRAEFFREYPSWVTVVAVTYPAS